MKVSSKSSGGEIFLRLYFSISASSHACASTEFALLIFPFRIAASRSDRGLSFSIGLEGSSDFSGGSKRNNMIFLIDATHAVIKSSGVDCSFFDDPRFHNT